MRLDLSPTSWGRVIAVTAAGTAFFIAVAFFVDSFNFPYLSPEAVWRAQMTDLMLPLVLGGSFLFFSPSESATRTCSTVPAATR